MEKSFFVHHVYVSFSLYYLTLTYVMLCRHPLSHWCLKSTKARLLSNRLFPPARYMYVSLSLVTSFSIHVVYMSSIHYFILNWHICYFMQSPSEALVHEEHQIEVVVDPPPPPRQVHVFFSFFENIIFHPCSIYVSDYFYYLKLTYVTLCRLLVRQRCLESTKSVTHLWRASRYVYVSLSLIWCLKSTKLVTCLFPPNVHIYLLTLAYIYFLCSLIVSKWCLKSTQSGSLLGGC